MEHALRAYRLARGHMAKNGRAVVLFDRLSETTFEVETARDLRILLFAAAAAYRGARSGGCAEAADRRFAAVQDGDGDDGRLQGTVSPRPVPWE